MLGKSAMAPPHHPKKRGRSPVYKPPCGPRSIANLSPSPPSPPREKEAEFTMDHRLHMGFTNRFAGHISESAPFWDDEVGPLLRKEGKKHSRKQGNPREAKKQGNPPKQGKEGQGRFETGSIPQTMEGCLFLHCVKTQEGSCRSTPFLRRFLGERLPSRRFQEGLLTWKVSYSGLQKKEGF